MNDLKELELLEEVMRRTQPEPQPASWFVTYGPWIAAAVLVWLCAWLLTSGIEKAAYDAVNGMGGLGL